MKMKKILAILLAVMFVLSTASLVALAGPIVKDDKGIHCVDLLDFSAASTALWARQNAETGAWEQNEGPDDYGDVYVINGKNYNQPFDAEGKPIAPALNIDGFLKDKMTWSLTDGGEVLHLEVIANTKTPGISFVVDEFHKENILTGSESAETPRAEYVKIRVRNNSTATRFSMLPYLNHTGGGYKFTSPLLCDLTTDMNGKEYKSGTPEWETYIASMNTLNTTTNYGDQLQKDEEGNPKSRWGGALGEIVIFPFGYNISDGTGAYIGASIDIDYIVFGSLEYVTNYQSQLEIKEQSISKLELVKEPTKKAYYVGETIDLDGLELRATYKDGTTEILNNATAVANLGEASDKTAVTLKFGAQSVSYDVSVTGIKNIEITELAENLSFELSEVKTFAPANKYKVNFVDGTSADIQSNIKYTGDLDTVGTKTISANYFGFSTTFEVTLISPVDLEITAPETAYRYNSTIKADDFDITLVYNDGTKKAKADAKTSLTYAVEGEAKATGDVTVKVTAKDETLGIDLSKDVVVKVEVPTEMKVTTNPVKTVYEVGEEFDASGMVVSLVYADGKSVPMSEKDYRFRLDSSEPGDKDVRITSAVDGLDVSTTFKVKVEGTAINPPSTTKPTTQPSSNNGSLGLIIAIVAAVVVVAGGVVVFLVIKKKKQA